MIADKQAPADNNTMTPVMYSAVPVGQLSLTMLKPHITIHMLWRALKKSRIKYQLTANQLIMLNGLYLWALVGKGEFTLTGAENFVGYWNNLRTKKLIESLIIKGYIVLHSRSGNRIYYRLTPQAYNIASEIMNEFDTTCQKWYSKFNLSI